ncbi:YbhB/YbcL family Raf kinase inhibitor-like protein [uncultured Cetobacterium sp.]|uniref:YbhB/YbcL family Raf kinase inhibitor-like protein n=1 Tax=uncultured Cetobacterium sp. TaxID=527638 RepID=UPI002613625B|nr:YbhB/YbcL family Raf kinase inhibitor-like protein [uncultured Cetobacterium sp.]
MEKFRNGNFTLESNSIEDGYILEKHGKYGSANIDGIPSLSPHLKWQNIPDGTECFVVVMQDYDAIPVTGFSWIHWVAIIPKEYRELLENASREDKKLIQGVNSWVSRLKGLNIKDVCYFGGPTPPDKDHTYEIKIYALDKKLEIKKGFYLNELYKKMKRHILAEAVLEGNYKA